MKIKDLRELDKEDILAALGLAEKPSTTDRLLGTLTVFGVGLLVGAGAALLLAPKSGQELRDGLGERLRKFREQGEVEEEDEAAEESAEASNGEAHP
ncbi:MAG TPA: YtxH domain-containing protein [Polyangia bacterium]|jgi:gas vesicle protein